MEIKTGTPPPFPVKPVRVWPFANMQVNQYVDVPKKDVVKARGALRGYQQRHTDQEFRISHQPGGSVQIWRIK